MWEWCRDVSVIDGHFLMRLRTALLFSQTAACGFFRHLHKRTVEQVPAYNMHLQRQRSSPRSAYHRPIMPSCLAMLPLGLRFDANVLIFYQRDYVTFGSLLSQFRLSSVSLSSVCLSVTLLHPNQGVEAFGNISSPLCMLAIL